MPSSLSFAILENPDTPAFRARLANLIATFSVREAPDTVSFTAALGLNYSFEVTEGADGTAIVALVGDYKAESVLPPHIETTLDTAQELTDATRWAAMIDQHAISRVKDAYQTDASALPFLAWERSVDMWDEEWSDLKKRYATERAIPLAKEKGTATGYRDYVTLVGGSIETIDAPPMLMFPGRNMSAAEMEQWLQQFPQLRTYPYNKPGLAPFAFFSTNLKVVATDGSAIAGGTPVGPITPNGIFIDPSKLCLASIDYSQYLGQQSFIYYPKTGEMDQVDSFGSETISYIVPGSLEDCWFADADPIDAKSGNLLMVSDTQTGTNMHLGLFCRDLTPMAARVATATIDNLQYGDNEDVFTTRFVVPGDLTPITVVPEQVFQPGPVQTTDWYLDNDPVYEAGQPLAGQPYMVADDPAQPAKVLTGRFPTTDRSPYNIFNRIYLNDQSIKPSGAPVSMPPIARCFADHVYPMFPAYTARVAANCFGTLPPCAFFRWVDGFLIEPDLSVYQDTLVALRAVKSARDDVWLDTLTYDIATTSEDTLCGQIKCGQPLQLALE